MKRETVPCFGCEANMYLGAFGYYCFECDTYLPNDEFQTAAGDYFEALDAGDEVKADEIRSMLDYRAQQTIEIARKLLEVQR